MEPESRPLIAPGSGVRNIHQRRDDRQAAHITSDASPADYDPAVFNGIAVATAGSRRTGRIVRGRSLSGRPDGCGIAQTVSQLIRAPLRSRSNRAVAWRKVSVRDSRYLLPRRFRRAYVRPHERAGPPHRPRLLDVAPGEELRGAMPAYKPDQPEATPGLVADIVRSPHRHRNQPHRQGGVLRSAQHDPHRFRLGRRGATRGRRLCRPPPAQPELLSVRRRGVTVRSSLDCLIAQCAMKSDPTLFHHDRDFLNIGSVEPALREESFLDADRGSRQGDASTHPAAR